VDRKITRPESRFLSKSAFPIQNVRPSPSLVEDAAMQATAVAGPARRQYFRASPTD